MIHKIIPVGPLQCNCMILGCEKTREAILVDPGDEAPRILEELEKLQLTVKYILHTHAHFDHIGATGGVKANVGAPVCLHKADEFLYQNLKSQGQLFGMPMDDAPPIEKFLADNEQLNFGEHRFEVLHTPGHSPGSVCFRVLGTEERVLSGDTLFQQSIGRTDLWEGDGRKILASIRDRLLVLDDDVPVFPGHGPQTQIGLEKRSNPFL